MLIIILILAVLGFVIRWAYKEDKEVMLSVATVLFGISIFLIPILQILIPYNGPAIHQPLYGSVYDEPVEKVLAYSSKKEEVIPYDGDYIIKLTNKVTPPIWLRVFPQYKTYILLPNKDYSNVAGMLLNSSIGAKPSKRTYYEVTTPGRIEDIIDRYHEVEKKNLSVCADYVPDFNKENYGKELICSFEASTIEKSNGEIIVRTNGRKPIVLSESMVKFKEPIDDSGKIIVDQYIDDNNSQEYVIRGWTEPIE